MKGRSKEGRPTHSFLAKGPHLVHCVSVYPVSISNLAVALTYLIVVLIASSSDRHVTVPFAGLAPIKNLISPSLPGRLSYTLFLCVIHLMQLNRKCRIDSAAAPH